MQLLDQDNYHRDVGAPIYNEIVVDWYSPLFYDIYFDYGYVDDDSINNDNGDIIHNVLIHKLKVECKDNKEGAKQKNNIYLGYVNHFEYKSIIITKIDLFKIYIDTTHIIEASLRLAIHYSINQLKRNNDD
jgi:hypothetical protein